MYKYTDVQKDIFKTIIKKKDFKNSVFNAEDGNHVFIGFIYYFYYVPALEFQKFYLSDRPNSNYYHTSIDGFKKIIEGEDQASPAVIDGYIKDSKSNEYLYIASKDGKHYFNKKIIDKFGTDFLNFTYFNHILYIYDPNHSELIGGICETRLSNEKET